MAGERCSSSRRVQELRSELAFLLGLVGAIGVDYGVEG